MIRKVDSKQKERLVEIGVKRDCSGVISYFDKEGIVKLRCPSLKIKIV